MSPIWSSRQASRHRNRPSSAPNHIPGANGGSSYVRGLQRGTIGSSSSGGSAASGFSFAAASGPANVGKRQLVRRSAMAAANCANGGASTPVTTTSGARHRPASQGSARSPVTTMFQGNRAKIAADSERPVGNARVLARPSSAARMGTAVGPSNVDSFGKSSEASRTVEITTAVERGTLEVPRSRWQQNTPAWKGPVSWRLHGRG